MHGATLLAALAVAELASATPGTFSMKTYKNHQKHARAVGGRSSKLHKRQSDGAAEVILTSEPYIGGGFYYVNASVGTPPQEVKLDIDTGSSDVWMFGVGSCDGNTSLCLGGAFDDTASTSLTLLSEGGFEIQYFTEGSGVKGDYIADDFSLGDITLKNLTMGLARDAKSVTTGIMGISFDTNEAIVGQGADQPYSNFIDELKEQGIIKTKAYSLYLDDLNAATGSILFGGIDTAKFQGELGVLEIQPDGQSNSYSSFGVILSAMGVTDDSGTTVIQTQSLPNVVILDSGTAFTIVPSDIYAQIVEFFGAQEVEGIDGRIVPCDLGGLNGTFDFQFGGESGPIISVPYSEFAVPFVDLDSGEPYTDDSNNPVCRLGFSEPSSDNEPFLFGDTFLRSAYVVYDLENLQIGIAQTIYETTDSNIVVIDASGNDAGVPGTQVDAGTTIINTKTAGLAAGANENAAPTGSAAFTQTFGAGGSGFTGAKTTFGNRPTGNARSSNAQSSNVGTSFRAHAAGEWVDLAAKAGSAVAVLSVGAMLLL